MTDEVADFFHELESRGRDPLLAKVSGSVCFEIVEAKRADRWLVTIDEGDIAVAHKRASADCMIRGDKALFDELVRGRTNAMAAVLRGALVCTGDVELLLAIQRIFPGPPDRRPSHVEGSSSR